MLQTAITLRASAAAVASGSGAAVDTRDANGFVVATSLDLELVITALSGTLTTKLETSADGLTGWAEVVPRDDAGASFTFSPTTVVGLQARTFADLKRFVRVTWTLSAAGTATFAVAGDGFVEYASPKNLARLGLRGEWLTARGTATIVDCLRAKTDLIDGALAVQFRTWVLPLTKWGFDLREGCCLLLAADFLVTQGVEPDTQDEQLFERAARADRWLNQLAEGRRRPAGTVDRTPPVTV